MHISYHIRDLEYLFVGEFGQEPVSTMFVIVPLIMQQFFNLNTYFSLNFIVVPIEKRNYFRYFSFIFLFVCLFILRKKEIESEHKVG